MIINLFKGTDLFHSLKQYNEGIIGACNEFQFVYGRAYDVSKNEASWWFDPKKVRKCPISHVYPKCLEVQKDPRLCLILYAPNYLSLMLIRKLFPDDGTLIEDQAGGMGRLVFYLNKLGYNIFSIIESFEQLPKALLEANMNRNNIKYTLNNYSIIPKVVNLVGYTWFPKHIQDDTELVIVYNNEDIIIKGVGEDLMYRTDVGDFKLLRNKVLLCRDNHNLTKVYCNKNKYEEFSEKLKEYAE